LDGGLAGAAGQLFGLGSRLQQRHEIIHGHTQDDAKLFGEFGVGLVGKEIVRQSCSARHQSRELGTADWLGRDRPLACCLRLARRRNLLV